MTSTSSAPDARFSRRIVQLLTLLIALSLGAAVSPARSRDRGTRPPRNVTARAPGGSQRWDFHHECELALHAARAEWHATSSSTAPGATSSPDGNDARALLAYVSEPSLSFLLAPVSALVASGGLRFDAPTPRPPRSRAPPATL